MSLFDDDDICPRLRLMPVRRRTPKPRAPPKRLPPPTCPAGFCCSACKENVQDAASQKQLAVAMGLHDRLGADAGISVFSPELVKVILDMTKTKQRQVPDWMGCSSALRRMWR